MTELERIIGGLERLSLAVAVPTGPINDLPVPTSPASHDHEHLLHLLRQELAGVELGAADQRVLAFLAHCGHEAALVVASLLRRVYLAGLSADRGDPPAGERR